MRSKSATQVSTFLDCERKFFFDYVLGLKPPPPPAAQLGTNAHEEVENYYLDAVVPKDDHLEGRMARAFLEQAPPRGQGITSEEFFELPTFDGGPLWAGKIDVFDRNTATVIDLKTCKDFRFAKMTWELLTDAQMVSYAHYAETELPSVKEIHVRHVYVLSKSKSPIIPTLVTAATFSKERLLSEWGAKTESVKQMVVLELARPEPGEVRPNPLACGKYGGCSHRERCGLPSEKRFGGMMTMTTLSELQKAVVGAGATGILPPPVAPSPPPAVPTLEALPSVSVPAGYYVPDGTIAISGYTQPAVKRLSDGAIFAMPKNAPVPQVLASTETTTTQVAQTIQSQGQGQEDVPKKRRGRPAKNGGNGHVAVAEADTTALATEVQVEVPLELWIDTLPTKGFPTGSMALEDWMRPALDIATKLAGQDWRSVEYGKGAGYLFAALKQHADATGVPSGVVVVRSAMAGADVAIEFLTPFAQRVMQGIARR